MQINSDILLRCASQNSGYLRRYTEEKSVEYVYIFIGLIIFLIILLKGKNRDPRDIPGIPKPKYDESLHHFTAEAIKDGKEDYEKVLHLNNHHPNQEIVIEYASICEDLIKFTNMYFSTSSIEDVSEVERQAYYWAAWSQEYMKKEEDMRNTHNLIATEDSKE